MSEKLILEFIGKDEISKTTKGITGALGGLGKMALGGLAVGLTAATVAITGLGAGLADSIGAAMEAQEVQAQLNSVIESTGGVAGVTSDMANELASSIQSVTRFEDDAILKGENMLLTFTSIGKDVFPAATQTMADMSQALGQDLTQSAMMLGKALNDPVQGVGALRRVGVQFTEEQENMIKALVETGDVAGAQKIILQELQKEFGGSAVAAGQTFGGQLDRLKNIVGDVKESIGGAFLPILQELAGMLLSGLNSPQFQAMLKNLSDFLTGTLIPATIELIRWFRDEVMPRFAETGRQVREALGPALKELWDAIKKVADALGIQTGKVDAGKTALDGLKMILDLVVIAARVLGDVIRGVAAGVDSMARAVRAAKGAWEDMKRAAQDAVNAIPDWLIPGSPTPFELGIRGIGQAMQDVSRGGLAPVMASAAAGPAASSGFGGPVVINLTYAPAVSLADRYEAETTLVPFIISAMRQAGVKVG